MCPFILGDKIQTVLFQDDLDHVHSYTSVAAHTLPPFPYSLNGSNISNFPLGSESEGEDGSQVELELAELTLGTLDLREFEILPKRRRRKRNKEKNRDLEAGAHVPLPQQPQDDEAKSPAQPELWDVLLVACRAGDMGMLKLQLAASPVDPGVLSLLSAPLGSGGFTLLHAAAAAGRGSVVRLLLEAGADPTVQ